MVQTRLLLLAVFLTLAPAAGAQTVAEDVVKGQEIQGVEFRNYVGPHKVIETRAAIQGIGTDLGRQMVSSGAQADYGRKYSVVRIHDPASDLLSADLFILGADAGVDHIRNLNWIVSAYLQQAFGYSVEDADLLANFITRYNAFYRGRMDHVQKFYIPQVAEQVKAENLGLALSYADWPGKTKMLIPLRDSLSKGLGGSINTEEISNKDIVTQMAQEPGALEERKKLADLKEGEIVQEQKAIAKAEASTPQAAVPSGLGTTAPSPTTTPPASQSTPASTPVSTTPATLPLEEAKKDLAARDQALQAERQDIVAQTPSTPTTPTPVPAVVKPAATTAFVHMNEATKMGQLWLIDVTKAAVWKRSELNTVRKPEVVAFGPGLLVVAGDSQGANAAVRLVLLSKDDASVLVTGADDVHPTAPWLVVGNQVYALTKGSSGAWVLGLFDLQLKRLGVGTDALSPLAAIVATPQGLLVQSGTALLLLDPTTLKKKSNTEG